MPRNLFLASGSMSNKSKLYQHKIVEIPFEAHKLNNFAESRGIGNILTEHTCDERIEELREQLKVELYKIIHGDALTEHQRTILLMRLMGKTQNEIAEHLGITQSAVHKALHGNIDYKNDKKRYGGVHKKLKKLCENNENIQRILVEIAKVKNPDVQ